MEEIWKYGIILCTRGFQKFWFHGSLQTLIPLERDRITNIQISYMYKDQISTIMF